MYQKPQGEELNFGLMATTSSAQWNHILIFTVVQDSYQSQRLGIIETEP